MEANDYRGICSTVVMAHCQSFHPNDRHQHHQKGHERLFSDLPFLLTKNLLEVLSSFSARVDGEFVSLFGQKRLKDRSEMGHTLYI